MSITQGRQMPPLLILYIMIQYNELRVEDSYLYLDVQVEDEPYFSNVMIEGARIDTPLTYGTKTPYHPIDESEQTRLVSKIFLPAAKNDLLFITPNIIGNPAPDAPCNRSANKIGVVYDKKVLMQKGLVYLKELGNSCVIPKGFIDFILRVKALDMAIETCNYTEAIKYWEMLNRKSVKTVTNNCGCHGLN